MRVEQVRAVVVSQSRGSEVDDRPVGQRVECPQNLVVGIGTLLDHLSHGLVQLEEREHFLRKGVKDVGQIGGPHAESDWTVEGRKLLAQEAALRQLPHPLLQERAQRCDGSLLHVQSRGIERELALIPFHQAVERLATLGVSHLGIHHLPVVEPDRASPVAVLRSLAPQIHASAALPEMQAVHHLQQRQLGEVAARAILLLDGAIELSQTLLDRELGFGRRNDVLERHLLREKDVARSAAFHEAALLADEYEAHGPRARIGAQNLSQFRRFDERQIAGCHDQGGAE